VGVREQGLVGGGYRWVGPNPSVNKDILKQMEYKGGLNQGTSSVVGKKEKILKSPLCLKLILHGRGTCQVNPCKNNLLRESKEKKHR